MTILEALREIRWSIVGDGYGERPSILIALLCVFDLLVFGLLFGFLFLLKGRRTEK